MTRQPVEVIVGDEILDLFDPEEEDQGAAYWAGKHFEASVQEKAWAKQKGIAGSMLAQRQDDLKKLYHTGAGDVVTTIHPSQRGIDYDKAELHAMELTKDEWRILALAASGYDREKIDKGLAGLDASKWKPATNLGKAFMTCMSVNPAARRGYTETEIAKRLAP